MFNVRYEIRYIDRMEYTHKLCKQNMRAALFWEITQHIVEIIYRRPRINSLPRNVSKELPLLAA